MNNDKKNITFIRKNGKVIPIKKKKNGQDQPVKNNKKIHFYNSFRESIIKSTEKISTKERMSNAFKMGGSMALMPGLVGAAFDLVDKGKLGKVTALSGLGAFAVGAFTGGLQDKKLNVKKFKKNMKSMGYTAPKGYN